MNELLTGVEAAAVVLANPDKYAPMLRAALKRSGGAYELSDLIAGINSGEYGVWLSGGSIMLTDFVTYPRKRCLSLFMVAGNRQELFAMLPAMEQFAADQGCSEVEMLGRKGWLRFLPSRGYAVRSYVITKEL